MAARKTFGEEGTKAFGKVPVDLSEGEVNAIRNAEMKMEGDTARIVIVEDRNLGMAGGELMLKKIGGNWKVDAGSLLQKDLFQKAPEELKERVMMVGKMTSASGEVTREIEAGKFATAGEAFMSFYKRAKPDEVSPTTQGK